MTDLLRIEQVNDQDVVDSRLIANRLGIQHKNLLETILKYQEKLEEKFGVILFEMSKPKKGSLGGRPEKFVWLNENHLTFLFAKMRNGLSEEFINELFNIGFDFTYFVKIKTNRKYKKESDYCNSLAKVLNGQREIKTLAGNIDILTSTEIIEVKGIKMWKHALGQVLVYGYYYPSHKKRIHLYGETQESFLKMVRNHCKRFNVIVTWEY